MTVAVLAAGVSGGGNPLFFAVSVNGTSRNATSIDGTTWTEVFPSGGAIQEGNNSSRSTLAQGTWFGTQGDYVSRNGSASSNATTGLSISYSMCYGNGKYVAVGSIGINTFYASYATTLAGTWTTVALTGGSAGGGGSAVDYLGSLFVTISPTGYISTSSDGVTWALRYSGAWAGTNTNNALDYGAGEYCCRGFSLTNGEYIYSSDGTTWASKIIPGFTSPIAALIFWGSTWYAFNNTQYATTTTPGTTASWSVASSVFGSIGNIQGVASSVSGKLVLFGGSSTPNIATSTNGSTWSGSTLSSVFGAAQTIANIAYSRT